MIVLLTALLASAAEYEVNAQNLFIDSIKTMAVEGDLIGAIEAAKAFSAEFPSSERLSLVSKLFSKYGITMPVPVSAQNKTRQVMFEILVNRDGYIYINDKKITRGEVVRLSSGAIVRAGRNYVLSTNMPITVHAFNGIKVKFPAKVIVLPRELTRNSFTLWLSPTSQESVSSMKFLAGGKKITLDLKPGQIIKMTIFKDNITGRLTADTVVMNYKIRSPFIEVIKTILPGAPLSVELTRGLDNLAPLFDQLIIDMQAQTPEASPTTPN